MKDALEQKEKTRKLKMEEGKKQDNITFGHFYNDIKTRHGEASADFMVGPNDTLPAPPLRGFAA